MKDFIILDENNFRLKYDRGNGGFYKFLVSFDNSTYNITDQIVKASRLTDEQRALLLTEDMECAAATSISVNTVFRGDMVLLLFANRTTSFISYKKCIKVAKRWVKDFRSVDRSFELLEQASRNPRSNTFLFDSAKHCSHIMLGSTVVADGDIQTENLDCLFCTTNQYKVRIHMAVPYVSDATLDMFYTNCNLYLEFIDVTEFLIYNIAKYCNSPLTVSGIEWFIKDRLRYISVEGDKLLIHYTCGMNDWRSFPVSKADIAMIVKKYLTYKDVSYL